MLIFLANGSLGNQLFQYVFLKTIQEKDELILVSGFEDLEAVFSVAGFTNCNKRKIWVRILLFRVVKPILVVLSRLKIISSVSVDHFQSTEKAPHAVKDHERKLFRKSFRTRREKTTYTTTEGYFSNFRFVHSGFFQSEQFFSTDVAKGLSIKKSYVDQAAAFLEPYYGYSTRVFVHVRRGDYAGTSLYGKSTILPVSYFRTQIDFFLAKEESPVFIFLSDEPDFIRTEFGYLEEKAISFSHDAGVDLAIMSLCNSAILSPSSFGWWGSYLMQEKGTVFAPEYWMGFNSKIYYHDASCPIYATKVAIED